MHGIDLHNWPRSNVSIALIGLVIVLFDVNYKLNFIDHRLLDVYVTMNLRIICLTLKRKVEVMRCNYANYLLKLEKVDE